MRSSSSSARSRRAVPCIAALVVLSAHGIGFGAPQATIGETREVWAGNADPNDLFGSALAFDGNVLIVGAPGTEQSGLNDVGSAYAFEEIAGQWVETGELVSSSVNSHDLAGRAVGIVGDTILVGSTDTSVAGPSGAGAVFLFEKSGTTWTEQGFLSASDAAAGDAFSAAIAVDRTRVVVGAYLDDGGLGSAYVFELQGSTWVERQKLQPTTLGPVAQFGSSAAVSGDTVVVGAPGDDIGREDGQGSVYVFEWSGSSWHEVQKLTASDGAAQHRFGFALGLKEDTLLVGAKCTPAGGTVYSFRRGLSSWTEVDAFSTPLAGQFGQSLALIDGFAVVCAPGAQVEGVSWAGAALLLSDTPFGWKEVARLAQSDPGVFQGFGASVVSYGGRVLIGAQADRSSGTSAGSVYEFDVPLPTNYCSAKTNSQGCVPFVSSLGAPSASLSAPFRITAENVLANQPGFLFYGLKRSNLDFHGGKLCVKLPFTRVLPPKQPGSGGTATCTGVLFRNFNKRIQDAVDPLLTAGQVVRAQWLLRGPDQRPLRRQSDRRAAIHGIPVGSHRQSSPRISAKRARA